MRAAPRVAGAVLIGGASRRMGRPKALVEVDGTPMAARVADALERGGCGPVQLIGDGPIGDGLPATLPGYPLVPDRWPGQGPLGGVITALLDAGTDVVVAACDLPDLDPATVRSVRDAAGGGVADAVVAVTDRRQPALARWNHAALDRLSAMFASGERALHVALDRLDVVEVAVEPGAMRNVNTPGDLGGDAASR